MVTPTPSVATSRQDQPTASSSARSASTPTSNSSRIAPISATSRSVALSRSGSSAVTPNRPRFPSSTPISSSPKTGGCPILPSSSPPILAAAMMSARTSSAWRTVWPMSAAGIKVTAHSLLVVPLRSAKHGGSSAYFIICGGRRGRSRTRGPPHLARKSLPYEFEPIDDDFDCVPAGRRFAAEQPQIDSSVLIAGGWDAAVEGMLENQRVGGGGRHGETRQARKVCAQVARGGVLKPVQNVGRARRRRRLHKAGLVPGHVIGLHRIPAVVVRGRSPAREFDIEFPVIVGRIVAPSEQAQHHAGVQTIERAVHIKPVGPVAQCLLQDNFRKEPLCAGFRNLQMQASLGVNRNVVL